MTWSGPGPVLVTGASGFLGRHLLAALAAERVPGPFVLLSRDPVALESLPERQALPGTTVLGGAIEAPEAWQDAPALAGLRGILHLAATVQHREDEALGVEKRDIAGAVAMVRLAARTAARVVAVSTSGTVGCSTDPLGAPDEEALFAETTVRRWPYYRGKIAAERAMRSEAGARGVPLVILRPPVLLGPGDAGGRSTRHVRRCLEGKLYFVVAGGLHFVDVRDAARAIVRVLCHPAPRPVYHLPGHASSIAAFFAEVAEIGGVRAPRFVLPAGVALALARLLHPLHLLPEPTAVAMASHWWGLATRYAGADLGHAPRPARETLADTIADLKVRARD